MSNVSKYNKLSNVTSNDETCSREVRSPKGGFVSCACVQAEKSILQNTPSYISGSVSQNNTLAVELLSVSSASHVSKQYEEKNAIIIPDAGSISLCSEADQDASCSFNKSLLSRPETPKRTSQTVCLLPMTPLQKSYSDTPSSKKKAKGEENPDIINKSDIDADDIYSFNDCINDLNKHPEGNDALRIDKLSSKLRGHFSVLPRKIIDIYNEFNKMAAEILAENSYNGIQMFFVERKEGKHKNGKPKISYKIIKNPELEIYIDQNDFVYSNKCKELEKKIKNYEEKISKSQSEIRVEAKQERAGVKNTGLDEIFQTSETIEFFYRSAGVIKGVKSFSEDSNGMKYTWLDCQKDFRLPTGVVIFTNGAGHSGALFSKEGYKGLLTKGQDSFHRERNAVILKSKNPFGAIIRALKYMRFGNIIEKDKTRDKSIRMPSTDEFLKGGMYESPTYNTSGYDYFNLENRKNNVKQKITSVRNGTRDIHKVIFPLAQQNGDTMSHYSQNTDYSFLHEP